MNKWLLYEIKSLDDTLHGVMIRGRIRKYAIEQSIELLTENATDVENCVRFAVMREKDAIAMKDYISDIIANPSVDLVDSGVNNPVLSKLKVNQADRYTL